MGLLYFHYTTGERDDSNPHHETMAATLHGYSFQGPYRLATSKFNAVAGIYVIANQNGHVVDVGETSNLSDRIPCHDRTPCWNRNGGVNLWFHREPSQYTRLVIEGVIRDRENPVCGIR
jgi:hypothetical protein